MLNSLDQALEEFRRKASTHNDGIVKEVESLSNLLNNAKGVFENAMHKHDIECTKLQNDRTGALNNYIEALKRLGRIESDCNAMRSKAVSTFDQTLLQIEASMIALATMLHNGETVDGAMSSSHLIDADTTDQKQITDQTTG